MKNPKNLARKTILNVKIFAINQRYESSKFIKIIKEKRLK